ncbi:MAG: helix-turn-helix transcriptional regulator [Clostridia bacterium]|nr:helix-turn-helix transcriptional regulator [Clostridia bacterium]
MPNSAHGCSLCTPDLAREAMPPQEDVAKLAEFFRTIGSDTRLKILLALDRCELCAGGLAQALDMTPSAISNQLKALRQARLITVRRDGKMLYYRLADCHPHQIIHLGLDHVREGDSSSGF